MRGQTEPSISRGPVVKAGSSYSYQREVRGSIPGGGGFGCCDSSIEERYSLCGTTCLIAVWGSGPFWEDRYSYLDKLPWREAGPKNHLDDKVDSDQ